METTTSFCAPQLAAVAPERTPEATAAIGRLERFMNKRTRLATLPTPLHQLPGTSAAQGREVWIKRDDLTGLALGGNKARKLELLLAEALHEGARAVVTVGGPQSNHARTVAAAAAVAGLECHLVLGGPVPQKPSGNLLLNDLLGARMHFIGQMDAALLASTAQQLVRELNESGTPAVLVPLGGSTPLGALSYAAAYLEVHEQFAEIGRPVPRIVHATGSGATQAGLELGRHLAGDTQTIVGIDVAQLVPDLANEVATLAHEAGALLGLSAVEIAATVDARYFGEGYGAPTPQSAEALGLLARRDGIVADPVYTAKALWALDELEGTDPVLFWHTGGSPALFAEGVGYCGTSSAHAAGVELSAAEEGSQEIAPE